jgi:hypothetical protein
MLFGNSSPPHSDALAWGVGHLLVDGCAQVLGCVCVFWASGSRGSLVITRYQLLPLTPGKSSPYVLPKVLG